MELIDKSALVAEIERLIETNKAFKKTWKWRFKWFYRTIVGRLEVLEGLKIFLNTLEVKEANLEKEIDDYINEHFSECDDGVLISDANSTELTLIDAASIARYFFELGLKAKGG